MNKEFKDNYTEEEFEKEYGYENNNYEPIVNLYDAGKKSLMDRINGGEFMKIQAPMVRFSRLPFRMLVKKYGTDITYTPMIMAAEFNRSESARDSDFTVNPDIDNCMIAQFGVNNAEELVSAAEKVVNHCQGIDINCGCPQKWVMKEGFGANLLVNPDRIWDMVKQIKNRVPIPISIKIRIQPDIQKTIELVKRAEKIGVSWITVHGRTSAMRSSHPVDYDAIKLVKENVSLPVFANGDIFTLQQAMDIKERTGVNGVMAARGLLTNPALFMGYDKTPIECIKDFIDIYSEYGGLHPIIFQRHLIYMLYEYQNKNEKSEFNKIPTVSGIIDYINDKFLF